MSGIIIDLFAGGGGGSSGFVLALGRHPDVAVNHDPKAVAMHRANHPDTLHLCQDVWSCSPQWAARGRKVAWLHLSPDCTHHSKAKGGPPNRDVKRRDLAWVGIKWVRELLPTCVSLENVEEFLSWGPCDKDGVPIKSQAGASFRSFVRALRALGYAVQHRELRACDYGAPTIRKRLFLIARRDGQPIVWPKPTHGPGRPLPYRTAAECIDWTIPCPSIFERKRPLAENTLKRIAEGIKRYVLNAAQPFVVGIDNAGARSAKWGVDQPLSTVITKAKHALVMPYFVGAGGPVYAGKPAPADRPMNTLMTESHTALVSAFLAKHYGGVVGHGLEQPIGSVTTVDHHSLVAASIQKLNSGCVGSGLDEPLHTVTAGGHAKRASTGSTHALMTSHLVKLRGTCKAGQPVDEPAPTITSGGTHVGEVRAFLTKYYSQGVGQDLTDPAATVTTRDRMGLVTVTIGGQPYVIADIGMRMLQPRELYRAQGFPDSYIIGDDPSQGLSLTKAEQVRMCGNSVCPPVMAAIVRANYTDAQSAPRALPLLGVGL